MAGVSQLNQSVSIADAVSGIFRRKLLVLSCLALGITAGIGVLKFIKPSYLSEAQVLIEDLTTSYDRLNLSQAESRPVAVSERVVASQVAVIKSGDMQSRVVDQLNLTSRPDYNPQLKAPSSLKSFLISWGFSDDPRLLTPAQNARKQLDTRLTVYPTPESNVIGIKYSGSDPQIAADVANAMAENYVQSTREVTSGTTSRARDWLQEQISELRSKVAGAEAEVEKYRSEAGLLKGEKDTLGTQQISELNSQISLAEAASTEAAARADEIKRLLADKGNVDASSDVLSSSLIQSLRGQQSAASAKFSELSAVYLPNHPKMISAQQELNSINRAIRNEAAKVVDSLIGQAKVAAARANALRQSLGRLKETQSEANQSDVKLKELQRNADASRVLLEQMMLRFADANSRRDMSLQPGYARVVQKAMPQPSNYFPKPGPILALTSFAGLALGLGLAFLFSVMSATTGAAAPLPRVVHPPEAVPQHPIRAAQQQTSIAIPELNIGWPTADEPATPPVAAQPTVERQVEKTLAVLAAMPSATSLSNTLAMIESTHNGVSSPVSDAANRIASAIATLKDMQGLTSIALISIGGRNMDAGLATVALTRAIAQAKRKVIAIDLSNSNSPFDAMFEIPTSCGISDLVAGEADFTKIICRDSHSTAHLIRYGQQTGSQFQTTIAEKLEPILKALAGIYDIVLIHSGEATPSTPALIKSCKGVLLLAPQTRYKDAVAAARVLELKGMEQTMFVRLDAAVDANSKQVASA